LFEKGHEGSKEVLGEDSRQQIPLPGADEFTRTMAEWSTEFCWGLVDQAGPSIAAPAASSICQAALGRPHD